MATGTVSITHTSCMKETGSENNDCMNIIKDKYKNNVNPSDRLTIIEHRLFNCRSASPHLQCCQPYALMHRSTHFSSFESAIIPPIGPSFAFCEHHLALETGCLCSRSSYALHKVNREPL